MEKQIKEIKNEEKELTTDANWKSSDGWET